MIDDDHSDTQAGFDLHAVFQGQEQELLAALTTGAAAAGHPGVRGEGTETRWHDLMGRILPQRYQVTRAIVVDADGHRSEQIDLAVVDRQYSPLFWTWGNHCYIPAESVYGVFEVRSRSNRENLLYAARKIASVRRLRRTSVAFGWAGGTLDARQPPPILGGFLAARSDWSPAFGAPFQEAVSSADDENHIDIGCVLGAGSFETSTNGDEEVTVSEPGTALVSFTLTLLKRLQRLGTAPAIDYDAYMGWTERLAQPE